MNKPKTILCQNIKTGETFRFVGLETVAKQFCVTKQMIYEYLQSGKPYKQTWCFDYAIEPSKEHV